MNVEIISKQDLMEFKADLLKEIKTILQPGQGQSKQWLKSNEVRKLLKISPGTLQNLRINGTLRYTKIGSHVSVFTALFSCYQQSGFQNPFPITRKTVMEFSKINSIATYHKCMRELDEFCYVRYAPSFHPGKGSLVYWHEGMQAENMSGERDRSEHCQYEPDRSETAHDDNFHRE